MRRHRAQGNRSRWSHDGAPGSRGGCGRCGGSRAPQRAVQGAQQRPLDHAVDDEGKQDRGGDRNNQIRHQHGGEVDPERPRGAFARIAEMVERSFFARRPLVETDWRACRAAYEDFAFAEGWRG